MTQNKSAKKIDYQHKRPLLAEKFRKESLLVREESMRALKDFEVLG